MTRNWPKCTRGEVPRWFIRLGLPLVTLLLLPVPLSAATAKAAAAAQGAEAPRWVRPVGPPIPIADSVDTIHLTTFEDGRFLVLTRTGVGGAYRGQFYGADDLPTGDSFQVGGAGEGFFGVATLDGRRWAIAWSRSACVECPVEIGLRIFDGADETHVVPVFSGAVSRYGDVVLTADGEDRIAVGWTVDYEVETGEDGENFSDAFARLFDYAGRPVGETFLVHESPFEEQNLRAATFLSTGDLVFVWDSYEGEGAFYDVFRRHFDGQGQPLEGDVLVSTFTEFGSFDIGRDGSQHFASIAALPDGYVIAWQDWNRPDPPGPCYGGVVAHTFAADGAFEREILVSQHSYTELYTPPLLAADADGSFVVSWLTRVDGSDPISDCDGAVGPDASGLGQLARSFHGASRDTLFSQSDTFVISTATLGDQVGYDIRSRARGGFLAAYETSGPAPRRALRRLEAEPCTGLCLGEGRFEANAYWRDFTDRQGVGQPVARDDDWGTFWFFRQTNVELAMKVLDGSALNGHFWVFFAALSNVDYSVDVWDLATGAYRRYENPAGRFASRGDTTALPAAAPTSAASTRRSAPPVARGQASAGASLSPCPSQALCLQDDRFLVDIEWRDHSGRRGTGVGAPFGPDSGWFWFFREGNPEVLVKVLDGGPVNGHWWVFYGALSNVGFDLTVTDRATGESVTYGSPLGEFAARGDTTAFPNP